MMRNTLQRYFAILLFTVGFSYSGVASSGIAVRLTGFTVDTQSVSLGYTLNISALVTNTDTLQPFSGTLDFGMHNSQHVLSNEQLFNKPPYSGNQIFLNPGEVVPALFSIEIGQPYFIPGPDVVVVWPISPTPITDSILLYLHIEDPTGVGNYILGEFSYLVTNDQILLDNKSNKINLQQVRIFNVMGQLEGHFEAENITQIPLHNLPHGIYFCEITGADNKRKVIRFYH